MQIIWSETVKENRCLTADKKIGTNAILRAETMNENESVRTNCYLSDVITIINKNKMNGFYLFTFGEVLTRRFIVLFSLSQTFLGNAFHFVWFVCFSLEFTDRFSCIQFFCATCTAHFVFFRFFLGIFFFSSSHVCALWDAQLWGFSSKFSLTFNLFLGCWKNRARNERTPSVKYHIWWTDGRKMWRKNEHSTLWKKYVLVRSKRVFQHKRWTKREMKIMRPEHIISCISFSCRYRTEMSYHKKLSVRERCYNASFSAQIVSPCQCYHSQQQRTWWKSKWWTKHRQTNWWLCQNAFIQRE